MNEEEEKDIVFNLPGSKSPIISEIVGKSETSNKSHESNTKAKYKLFKHYSVNSGLCQYRKKVQNFIKYDYSTQNIHQKIMKQNSKLRLRAKSKTNRNIFRKVESTMGNIRRLSIRVKHKEESCKLNKALKPILAYDNISDQSEESETSDFEYDDS